jgi:DNA-binding response OmpR family regulator
MPSHARPRVLTVEDDPIIRAHLRVILEDAGFDVCAEARDGYEAVDHARDHRPDLILLDLGLPRLSGVEATRLILDEQPVPIVALTGHANVEAHREAIDAGAADIVLKPFSEHELVGKVRSALTVEEATPPPAVLHDDSEAYRMHALVERLVGKGHSQSEIERELRSAGGGPEPGPGPVVSFVVAAVQWIRQRS